MREDEREEEEQRLAKIQETLEGLGIEELRLLSNEQLQICQNILVESNNRSARKRIDAALKDQLEKIAEALTTPPYVYTSPEIRIMAGCEVRFSTLMTAQRDDAYTQLDRFMSETRPSSLRVSDFLNKHLLAHSLSHLNGQDFGGVTFSAQDYQVLRTSKPDKAADMLAEIRNKRIDAIGGLSPHIYDRLVEFYQAFQLKVEEMSRGDEMTEALGN
jgi:hypothetical protein